MSSYPAPLDRLLTLPEPEWWNKEDRWEDYRQFGLGPEHIPDLTRMATDPELNQGEPESPEVYAPVHAWRSLAQIGGISVLPTFIDLLLQSEEYGDDWFPEEFPTLVSRLGPDALPTLLALIGDPTLSVHCRNVGTEAVEKLVQGYPHLRDESVRALTEILAAPTSDPTVNGFIISDLIQFRALESAAAMEAAFAAGRVDEFIVGGWPDVRYELGLGPPPPRHPIGGSVPVAGNQSPRARADDRKARRKRERKARKRNRKSH